MNEEERFDFEQKHEEDLQRLRGFRLLDDDFMSKVFEDKNCVEFLLQIILKRDDLKVTSVSSQYVIKNLQGRSVRLDILAVDRQNQVYNIEIQRDDFTCTNAKDMYYEVLADRVHYFKEDEKGVAIMCKAMEDMRNEAAREAEKMKAIRMARLMIEDGKLNYEDIAMYTELTLEEVEKIALEKKSA